MEYVALAVKLIDWAISPNGELIKEFEISGGSECSRNKEIVF